MSKAKEITVSIIVLKLISIRDTENYRRIIIGNTIKKYFSIKAFYLINGRILSYFTQ